MKYHASVYANLLDCHDGLRETWTELDPCSRLGNFMSCGVTEQPGKTCCSSSVCQYVFDTAQHCQFFGLHIERTVQIV